MKSIKLFLTVFFLSVAILSCENNPITVPVVSTTYKDLPADPGTGGRDQVGNLLGTKNKFTFFSFKKGQIVDNKDSATAIWDVGFKGTTIIVNSGTFGPGKTQAQIVTGSFDNYPTAPDDGYTSDSFPLPDGTNKWYSYDNATMVITPIAGRVIVVKTADSRFAKLEILSYYKGSPAKPDAMKDSDRYYTFRYVYQPNDTKRF